MVYGIFEQIATAKHTSVPSYSLPSVFDDDEEKKEDTR